MGRDSHTGILHRVFFPFFFCFFPWWVVELQVSHHAISQFHWRLSSRYSMHYTSYMIQYTLYTLYITHYTLHITHCTLHYGTLHYITHTHTHAHAHGYPHTCLSHSQDSTSYEAQHSYRVDSCAWYRVADRGRWGSRRTPFTQSGAELIWSQKKGCSSLGLTSLKWGYPNSWMVYNGKS